jgi:REP element-mobilizing transposase RayT
MTLKYHGRYRVPSARALWHDYNEGLYFITICTAHKISYFGRVVDGTMHLNRVGQWLQHIIEETPVHHSYATIPVYVIMPNHVHLIIYIRACNDSALIDDNGVGNDGDAACHVSTDTDRAVNERMRRIAESRGLLSVTVGNIKSALKHYATKSNIEFAWQSRFYDHIIRNEKECNYIADYIEQNPIKWDTDSLYSQE